MNKQAFAFLTLFSLVLMLSVYYVTMPIEKGGLPVGNELIQENPQTLLKTMKNDLLEARSTLSSRYNDIISSSMSSESEKQDALSNLNKLVKIKELEDTVLKALVDAGYEDGFIEIDQGVIKIVCDKQYADNSQASKIMKIAMKSTNNQYVPEVSFK